MRANRRLRMSGFESSDPLFSFRVYICVYSSDLLSLFKVKRRGVRYLKKMAGTRRKHSARSEPWGHKTEGYTYENIYEEYTYKNIYEGYTHQSLDQSINGDQSINQSINGDQSIDQSFIHYPIDQSINHQIVSRLPRRSVGWRAVSETAAGHDDDCDGICHTHINPNQSLSLGPSKLTNLMYHKNASIHTIYAYIYTHENCVLID